MSTSAFGQRVRRNLIAVPIAFSLGACSSIDLNAVNLNSLVEHFVPPYTNYEGKDAARIRVIYGDSGNPYITVKGESAEGTRFTVRKGERINKTMMGTIWDWAPISLGMPGNPPKYAYTEISVPGGRTVTLQISFNFYAGTSRSTCSPTLDLQTVAGANYEAQLQIHDNICFVQADLI